MELFKLFGTILVDNDKANRSLSATDKQASQTSSSIGKSFSKIGGYVAGAFSVAVITNFAKECVEASASVNAVNNTFKQTFGDLATASQEAMDKVGESSNILSSRLTETGTKIFAFAKTSGMDSASSLGLMERALIVTADASAYYDRSLEDTAESLQSFLKGNYENDSALGLSCTETTRNTMANKLFGKSFKELSESQKQLALLQMVEDAQKLSGALGQASREGDSWENVTGNMQEAWKLFKAEVGEPMLEIIVPILEDFVDLLVESKENITQIVTDLRDGAGWVLVLKDAIIVLGLAFVGLKLGNLITSFNNMREGLRLFRLVNDGVTLSQGLLNKALSFSQILWAVLTGQMSLAEFGTLALAGAQKILDAVMSKTSLGMVISLIVAVAGALVLAYNHCETFRNFVNELWVSIKDAFGKIKDIIVLVLASALQKGLDKVEQFKLKMKAIFDTIVGFFNFKVKFPDIKLPHFNLTPKGWSIGDLLKGSIPKLGVDWYAKGGILEKPTVFGMNGNNVMVGGEAGKEAVAPLSDLMAYVRSAVREENNNSVVADKIDILIKMLTDYLPLILNRQMVLDSGTLVGELLPIIDVGFGNTATLKGRGVK